MLALLYSILCRVELDWFITELAWTIFNYAR
jgi:hypothetical protein